MTVVREEAVPALPLNTKRRLMGYIVPAMNLPLIMLKLYEMATKLRAGIPWNTPEFFNDIIILVLSIALTITIPNVSPVYTSKIVITKSGLKISRILKRTVMIPYDRMNRVVLYVRNEKEGSPSKKAIESAKEKINALKRSGFKFNDYTNDERIIALFYVENSVYVISPAYPKAFIQKIKKRVRNLHVELIELTSRRERIRNL